MQITGHQLSFEVSSSDTSKTPFQSFRGDKPRMSYGGGFHMGKKPAPPPQVYTPNTAKPEELGHRFSADPQVPPLHVIERELERLKQQSGNIEKLRSHHFQEGILHLDPPSHRSHSHGRQDFDLNKKISLQEIELLKEKNAARLVEIEAEIRRSKTKEVINCNDEYLPVYRPYKEEVKKPERLTGYQKEYYEKFERFMSQKEQKRVDNIIEAKIAEDNQNVLRSDRGRNLEGNSPAVRDGKRKFSPDREVKKNSFKEKASILRTSSSAKSLKHEKESSPTCLVPYKHMAKLEEIFLKLDVHQDFVVPRGELISSMLEDENIIKILHIDAVRVSSYQILDLESMLLFIKNDTLDSEELITWNQFLEYFFVAPIFEESRFEGLENPKLSEIDLPGRFVTLIQEVFEDLDKKTHNKVSTFEFIQALKNDTKTSALLSYTARIPEGLSHIPEETLAEVLERMQENAEALISWPDILGFLSKRGLPKDSLIGESLITRNSFVKAKKPPKPVKENFMQTEDLEVKKHSHRSRSTSPRQRVTFYEKDVTKDVTIPAPFQFEDREKFKKKSIREKWLEKDCEEREKELKGHIEFKYQARDVPREVSQPKYEKLKKALEDRSKKVRIESAEKTKQLEKPFSFYIREKEKPPKQQVSPPSYQFKANPIPWACTVTLYESRIREEEALREERKSRAAQENLRKASLPPRMEMYQHVKKSEIPKTETPSPKFTVKDPPNFKKLQERFEKTLEAKKSAKKNTLVEPFLIDQRVEENNKRKEENRKKREEEEAKKKEEEEKKRKSEEEKMRNERLKAKTNWKSDHESLKTKFSKPERKKSSSRSRESTPEGKKPIGFTQKDLSKDSITMDALRPSPQPKSKQGSKPGQSFNKSFQDKGKKSGANPNQASKKSPGKSGDFTAKDLVQPSKSGDFTMKDLGKSSNSLAPPSSNPLAPSSSNSVGSDMKKQSSSGFPSLSKPGDKSNVLAPSEKGGAPSSLSSKSNPLAPDKPSFNPLAPDKPSFNPLAPDKPSFNPLAPDKPSFNPLAPDKSSFNPLAPDYPSSNPLAPDKPSSNPLAPDKPSSNPLAPDKSSSNPLSPSSSVHDFSLPGTRYQDLQPIPEESSKHALSKPSAQKSTTSKQTKTTKDMSKTSSSKKYDTMNPLKRVISAEEQQSSADKNNINERLRKRKEEAKRQEEEYQEKLRAMKENVNKRPLLVESATDSSNKNRSKMKILLAIKKNLEDSGVKYEPYFTEEELALVQEAEYMSKMHRLKVQAALVFSEKDSLIDPGRILWPKTSWVNHPVEFSLNHAGENVTVFVHFSVSSLVSDGIVEVHFPEGFDVTGSEYYLQDKILVVPITVKDVRESVDLKIEGVILPVSPGAYGPFAIFTRKSVNGQVLDVNKVFCSVGILRAHLPPPSDSLTVSFFDVNMDTVKAKSTLLFTFTLTKDLWTSDIITISIPKSFSLLNPVCHSEDVASNLNYLKTSASDEHQFGCSINSNELSLFGLSSDIDISSVSDSKSLLVSLSVTGFTNPEAAFPTSDYIWDLQIFRYSSRNIIESFHGSGPKTYPGIVSLNSWSPYGNYDVKKIVSGMLLYMDLSFTPDHQIPKSGRFLVSFEGVDLESTAWKSDEDQSKVSGSTGYYYINPFIGGSCSVTTSEVECSGFDSDIIARNTLTISLLVKFQSNSAGVKTVTTFFDSETVIDSSEGQTLSLSYSSTVKLATSYSLLFSKSLDTTSSNRVCDTGGGKYYLVVYMKMPVALTLQENVQVFFPLSTTARADFGINFGNALKGKYLTSSSSQPIDLTSGNSVGSVTVNSMGITFSVEASKDYFLSVAFFKDDGSGTADQMNLPFIGSNEFTRYESRVEVVVSNAYYVSSTPFTILPHSPSMNFDLICTDSGKAGLPARITGSMNFDYSTLYYLYIDIQFDGGFESDLGSGLSDGEDYPFDLDSTSSLPVSSKMKLHHGSSPILTISGLTSVLKTDTLRAFFPIGSLSAGTYSVTISLYTLKKDRSDIHFEVFSKTVSRTVASNTKDWQSSSTTVSNVQVSTLITSSSQGGLDLSLKSSSSASDTTGYIGLVLPAGFSITNPKVTDGSEYLINVLSFSSPNQNFKFPGIFSQETPNLSLSKSTTTTLHFTGIKSVGFYSYSSPSVKLMPYEAKSSWNTACESITGTLPSFSLTRGVLSINFSPETVKGRGPGSLQQSIIATFKTISNVPQGSYIEVEIDSEWGVSDNTVFQIEGLDTFSVTSTAPYQISGFSLIEAGTSIILTISNLIPPLNTGSSDVKRGCLDSVSIYAGSSSKLVESWSDDTDSSTSDTCITVKPQASTGSPSYSELSTFPNTASTDSVSVFIIFSLENALPRGSSITIKSPTSSWALNGDIKDKCWFSLSYSSCSASGNSLQIIISEPFEEGLLTLMVDDCLDTPINIDDELSFTISTSFSGVSVDKDSDVGSSQTLVLVNPPNEVIDGETLKVIPGNAGEQAFYFFQFTFSCQIEKGDEIWIKFPDDYDPFIGNARVKFNWAEPNGFYMECESDVLGDITCKVDHWVLVVQNCDTVPAGSVVDLKIKNVINPGKTDSMDNFKLYLVDSTKKIKAMKSDFSSPTISDLPAVSITIRSISPSSKNLQEISDYTFSLYFSSLTISKSDYLLLKFPRQYLLDWDLQSLSLTCSSWVLDESDNSVSLTFSEWNSNNNCSYSGSNIVSLNISETGSWTETDKISLILEQVPNPEWGFDRSLYFDGQKNDYFERLTDWTGQFEMLTLDSSTNLLSGKSYGNLNSAFIGLKSSGRNIKIAGYDPKYEESHLLVVPGSTSSSLRIQVEGTWGLMAKKLVFKSKNHSKNLNDLIFTSEIDQFYIWQGMQEITFKVSAGVSFINSILYIDWDTDEYSLLGLAQSEYSKPCKTLVEVYAGVVFNLSSEDLVFLEKSSESLPIRIQSPVSPSSNFTLSLSFEEATLNGIELSPISLTFKPEVTEGYFTIKVSDKFNGQLNVNYSIKFDLTGPDSGVFKVPQVAFQVIGNSSTTSNIIKFSSENITRTSAALYITSEKTAVVYWQVLAYGSPLMSYSELINQVKPLTGGPGVRLSDQMRDFHESFEIEPGVNETWVDFERRTYSDSLRQVWFDVAYIPAGIKTLIASASWLWAETEYIISGYVLNNFTSFNTTFKTSSISESIRLELLFSDLVVESKGYPLTTIVAYSLGVPEKQLQSLRTTGSRRLSSTTLFAWVLFPRRNWDISPMELYDQLDQDKMFSAIFNSGITNTVVSFSRIDMAKANSQTPYWTNSGYPTIKSISDSSVSISLKSAVSGVMCCITEEYFSNVSSSYYPKLTVNPTQVLLQLNRENFHEFGACITTKASSFENELVTVFNLTSETNYTATCCAFNEYPIWPSTSAYSLSVSLPSEDFRTLKANESESEESCSTWRRGLAVILTTALFF